MKNYVSLNAKYYKNSNAQGEIGHVQRVFAENTNQIKQFAKDNFGCGYNIYDKYKETFDKVEEIKGKKIQSNSNTFIDGVLSFSRDQMLEVMKLPNWKKDFSEHIEMYMKDVKEKTGLEPLGWEMHMDEGYLDEETGEYKMNYHAQLIFFNFDFKTNKAPLRDLQGRKGDSVWADLQDVAAERFWDLGFTRGISAEITKAKHKEKDKFIAQKQAEIERLQAELAERQTQMDQALDANQELLETVAVKVDEVIDQYNRSIDIFQRFEERVELEKDIKKQLKIAVETVVDEFQSNTLLGALRDRFKSNLPSLYNKTSNLYNKIVNYFNDGSDAGDLIPLIKETQEALPELVELNEKVRRRNKFNI